MRAPDLFTAGRLLTYTELRRRKSNKHWKRRKRSLEAVRWIGAPVDEIGGKRCWSTRRAERAPSPFPGQHAIRRRQQPCLEAVTKTMAVRGRNIFRRWCVGKSAMRGQFLFCCSLQPSFQQSFERWLKILNSHVALKLKVLGTDRPCRGPWGISTP